MPAVLSLFHPGFFESDDGEWMIIRFSAFHEAIRDGQFPVRFLSRLNYGYGYPVANFLYPGFMYLSEPIHLLGFGFVNTIKIILGLSMIGSAIFCFIWLSKFFNKFSAAIGAMFYLYLPYHLYDIYKRGSVGEMLALAIVPFTLWQIERKSFFWSALGIAFLIISHNTLALLFLPIIFIYGLLRYKISDSQLKIYQYIGIFAVGLGASAFFWIPALFDLQYTVFFKTKISEWQNYFPNIDIVSYLSLIIIGISIIAAIRNKVKGNTLFFLLLGLMSLFLATAISSSVWKVLPISFVQFPFRFLSIEILAVSYLVGSIISNIKGTARLVVGGILIILIFISAYQYKPSVFFDKGDLYYATNEDSTTVKKEYMPIWVKNNPTEHYKEKAEIVNGKISDLKVRPNNIGFVASSTQEMKIKINTIYFPGWIVNVDGKSTSINYEDEGLIKINIPAGAHTIKASFKETPIRLISDAISIGSILILLIIVKSKGMREVFKV